MSPVAHIAQPVNATLFAAVLETDGFIVGDANAGNGVHRMVSTGEWVHLGWGNIRCYGVAVVDPDVLYLAAGNGAFRSMDAGASWRQLTGWRITEVTDLALDPLEDDVIYVATSFGPWRSDDGGASWMPFMTGIPSPRSTFAQAIAVDHEQGRYVIAGTEGGLYRTDEHRGAWTIEQRADRTDEHRGAWTAVGPSLPIRALHQSAARPNLWLAGTDGRGVLVSVDGGMHWDETDAALASSTIWAVAADPTRPERLAAAGFETGIYVSDDGGASWIRHPADFPAVHVHALAFDPTMAGRLWAGTVGRGVMVADFGDAAWTFAGLPGATVWDLVLRGEHG